MKHLFVPYEVAMLVKNLGFNEPCFGWYSNVDELLTIENVTIDDCKITLLAPTYQQVIDWLRETYNSIVGSPERENYHDSNDDLIEGWQVTTISNNQYYDIELVQDYYEAYNLGVLGELQRQEKKQKQKVAKAFKVPVKILKEITADIEGKVIIKKTVKKKVVKKVKPSVMPKNYWVLSDEELHKKKIYELAEDAYRRYTLGKV
jgi:hypothetical protein